MVKNYSKNRKTKKSLIAALCAVTVTCTGLAAACAPQEEDNGTTTPKPADTQLLKNGNFEFYGEPSEKKVEEGKAIYLIKEADNWSRSGDSSNAKSGVISVSDKSWKAITAEDIKDKLDYNNDLSSSDDDYIDYNGMRSRDLLYKDTYAALLADEDVEDSYIKYQTFADYFGITKNGDEYKMGDTTVFIAENSSEEDWKNAEFFFDSEWKKPVRKEFISNPETHYGSYEEKDGKYFLGDKQIYLNDAGEYFLDKDLKEPCSNVLMVHNYPTDNKYNGISQYYSSQTITLEANTAAEISLWVKTSDLKFDKGTSLMNEQDRGAFIEVVQTVGGSTLDSFIIKSINTEKIIKDNKNLENESNGWLQYTIFVNACDFATSTIRLNLGLGQSDNEKCTGYAFFDDAQVTKYVDLSEESDNYKAAVAGNKLENTTCNLADTDENKIFIADKALRGTIDDRHSTDFHYLLDLASETGAQDSYATVTLDSTNTTAGLTTEDSGNKTYVSSESNAANYYNGTVGKTDNQPDWELPKNLKNNSRNTKNDLIGIFGANDTFQKSMFDGRDYSQKLNDALTGDKSFSKLPNAKADGNMLVMLSAYGAAYTAKVSNFTLADDGHVIISLWVKTPDMGGNTAATLKVSDEQGEEVSDGLLMETTNITTDIGDKEDIYNGWVQCFFFVENTSGSEKTFNLEFSFGNTSLGETAITSYKAGWAAIANVQTLNVSEEIFKIASSGDRLKTFTFTKEDEPEEGNKFDEASGTSDIKKGFANASSYSGVNGAGSSVSDSGYLENYDAKNTNTLAGLINKETDESVLNSIYANFGQAGASWNEVFGSSCYQPLVIINNIRTYSDKAEANEINFKKYWVVAEEGFSGDTTEVDGVIYRRVADSDTFDPETKYYSLDKVLNYGYVGTNGTVASNGYTTLTVRVKVSEGAKAFIYVVDSDTREVLSYSTPGYTFWYDEEGNVLSEEFDSKWTDSEHREKIVYELKDNGLYGKYGESDDKKTYANLYNLIKSYKYYKYEHNLFYDDEGNTVSFDDLVDGQTYYSDKEHTKIANHFLCNSKGTRVFEFENGTYYYLVEGERGVSVENFDKNFARYDYTALNEKLAVEVGPTGNEWKTVNFVIHAGSEAKNYRLELWSGARDEKGDTETPATGAVAFDYSAYSVTENNYSNILNGYSDKLIREYKSLLSKHGAFDKVNSNEENVAYYENLVADLVKEGTVPQADVDVIQQNYSAKYYSYTLYDSEAYVPFNAETAKEGETGYEYKITDTISLEKLAFFTYDDKEQNSVNVFADFSAVDQSVTIGTVDEDEEDNDDDTDSKAGELALYISSIILVVALLLTLVSLLARDFIKKYRLKHGSKTSSKNNLRQRERYIRKLGLARTAETTETESSEDTETKDSAASEETVEEVTETTESVETESFETEPTESSKEPSEGESTDEKPEEE